MSLLGKLHRQQGIAGGGAMLHKEAGPWLVSGRMGGGGGRMSEARELREWLNGTESEGEGGGRRVGKERDTEIAADGLLHSTATHLQKDRLYVWQCVCMHA